MTRLSVNINKIATLRNARGKNLPDVVKAAMNIESYGAQGITVHPRPDERHIRKADVFAIAKKIKVEFNIEGYPSREFLDLVKKVRPAQCTLVPDPPEALTSNAGWNVKQSGSFLKEVVEELHRYKVRTSLFMDPNDILTDEIMYVKETGTDCIELYTEAYAEAFPSPDRDKVLSVYKGATSNAREAGIGVNAGHDLNLHNLSYFIRNIPDILEVSIGHALVSDALYYGLEATVKKYLKCLKFQD